MGKIWIIVIVIVLVALAYYMFMRNQPGVVPSYTAQTSSSDSSESKGSIQSLLTAGKNVTCTINYPDQAGSGTVYVSGNKFRGDFNLKAREKEMVSHMIKDAETAYMWSDGSDQGTMFKMDAVKPSVAPGTPSQTTDLNKEVDYKCSPGGADAAKFTPPANVKFTDMSAMMKNVEQSPAKGTQPKMDKSVCDAIADSAAKAQCISAFN